MAYCPPELLEDLADVFADVRTWIGVIEKRPGVFYAHGQPFLHFHLLAGARRQADVKSRSAWTQLNLPWPVRPRAAEPWFVSCRSDMTRRRRLRTAYVTDRRTTRSNGPGLAMLAPAADRGAFGDWRVT
jgi:hypothetical protein